MLLHSDPLLGWVEQEGDLLRLSLRILVVSWTRDSLSCRAHLHVSLGLSKLLGWLHWQDIRSDVAGFAVWVVVAWTWFDLDGPHRSDWQSEPVDVVLEVHLAALYVPEFGLAEVVVFSLDLRNGVEVSLHSVSGRTGRRILLFVSRSIRIVQVDRDSLLLSRRSELPSAHFGSLLELDIKAVVSVVGSRGRLKLVFNDLAGVLLGPGSDGLEDMLSSLLLFLGWERVVLANSRILLFEVDVHSDRLDVVQWVLLVERKGELAFGI